MFRSRGSRLSVLVLILLIVVSVAAVTSNDEAYAAGEGAVSVAPVATTVPAGGGATVDIVVEPPADTLSIWIIRLAYDPTVVQFAGCVPITLPPAGAGTVSCQSTDTNSDLVDDQVVVLGGYIENQGGTPVGIAATQSFATVSFVAIGNGGDSTVLGVEVQAFLSPDGTTHTPSESDGSIEIVAISPVGGIVEMLAVPTSTGSGPSGQVQLSALALALLGASTTAYLVRRRIMRG